MPPNAAVMEAGGVCAGPACAGRWLV